MTLLAYKELLILVLIAFLFILVFVGVVVLQMKKMDVAGEIKKTQIMSDENMKMKQEENRKLEHHNEEKRLDIKKSEILAQEKLQILQEENKKDPEKRKLTVQEKGIEHNKEI